MSDDNGTGDYEDLVLYAETGRIIARWDDGVWLVGVDRGLPDGDYPDLIELTDQQRRGLVEFLITDDPDWFMDMVMSAVNGVEHDMEIGLIPYPEEPMDGDP